MALPFYSPVKHVTQLNENIGKLSGITGKERQEPQFLKDLLLQEKGQLTTLDDKYQDIFKKKDNQITIQHKDMPWMLYRESYKRVPLVYNAVNNTADFAMQAGFELDASSDAKEKILKWFDDVNFELILLNIMKQLQIYGNSYLDISDLKFPKLLPPEQMHVIVQYGGDSDGKIIGFKQVIGLEDKKNITFTTEELIHFKWNDSINPFYGMSEVHPALGSITRYENFMLDLGEILHRYAAPIIQWIVGSETLPATAGQLDDFSTTVENRLPGEDIITSFLVKHEVVGAGQKMMQVDGLVKMLQNEIIAALRVPEVFARGGESSNKATAEVELEAFDRKVKAIQQVVSFMIEDLLFTKLTKGKVKIVWNEFSAEGELQRAQRLNFLVTSGIPVVMALKMTGLGTWADEVDKAKEEDDQKNMDKQQQLSQMAGQNKDQFRKPTGQQQQDSNAQQKQKQVKSNANG